MKPIVAKLESLKNTVFSWYDNFDLQRFNFIKQFIDTKIKSNSNLDEKTFNEIRRTCKIEELPRTKKTVAASSDVAQRIYDVYYVRYGKDKVRSKLISILYYLTDLKTFTGTRLTNLEVNQIIEEAEYHPNKFIIKRVWVFVRRFVLPFKIYKIIKAAGNMIYHESVDFESVNNKTKMFNNGKQLKAALIVLGIILTYAIYFFTLGQNENN